MELEVVDITRPDDWHLHLRDGELLARVVPYTARQFRRGIVMPNLTPPIRTADEAEAYRLRILAAVPEGLEFEPLMALYLTESTTVADVEAAAASPYVVAMKLYPMGVTTNSTHGISDLTKLYPVFAALEDSDLPLLVHGEATAVGCDVFDRERVFLDESLRPLVDRFEGLRVVFEHITTEDAVAFVESSPSRIAATITPQHLLLNRNAIFEGGLRPHSYCLPVLKRERDRESLVRAATSANPSFFLGTDSAPHERATKESACGCAGIFSAPIAIEAYAEAFHRAGAMDRLEAFASFHGADFYGIARNRDRTRLVRSDWIGPDRDGLGDSAIEVFWAGQSLSYEIEDATVSIEGMAG